jgi:hypothetical protein
MQDMPSVSIVHRRGSPRGDPLFPLLAVSSGRPSVFSTVPPRRQSRRSIPPSAGHSDPPLVLPARGGFPCSGADRVWLYRFSHEFLRRTLS